MQDAVLGTVIPLAFRRRLELAQYLLCKLQDNGQRLLGPIGEQVHDDVGCSHDWRHKVLLNVWRWTSAGGCDGTPPQRARQYDAVSSGAGWHPHGPNELRT